MTPIPERPPAVDVTPAIYDRMMARVPDDWKARFRDPLTWDDSMREQVASVLLPCAVDEAIAQSKRRGDRGLVLYDQKDVETIIYYIAQDHSDTVLWMADPATKENVAELVRTYNPETEAVIVIASSSSIQAMWVREDGTIQTDGAQAANSLPVSLPDGVTVSTEEAEGVYSYRFSHVRLGDLGRIRLVPDAESGLSFKTETASGDTETETQQKQELFAPLARTIVERLEAALHQK
ncbi:hypothetical protein CKA32_001806 [Geitlerinema sp. FC II]|nr:hypothetical protein [Geitlerinema sp. CS-897]PPT08467.1 hypothetical protein CKA32_001806 [Geitlerinema sp. FC II]